MGIYYLLYIYSNNEIKKCICENIKYEIDISKLYIYK